MDELKLTIQEAQELLLLSQSSVYSWIDKGKLRSIETPGGKLIVISRKEAEEIKNFNLKSRRNKAAKQFQQKNSDDSTILEISATERVCISVGVCLFVVVLINKSSKKS